MMKKRLLVLPLAGAMSVRLAVCGNSGDGGPANTPAGGETIPVTDGTGEPSIESKTVKVDMVCVGDEGDQGYTYNLMKAVEEATAQSAERGITVEWSHKKDIPEDSDCEDANIELAEDGYDITINNSYGLEPFMPKVTPDYPEIEFIPCTNKISAMDDLDNAHNALANIYEGRYLVGVAGGMKLQQMIDGGTITAEEAVIGYVVAFPSAEMVSGYTAFYQGAKSVYPSVTMEVRYVNSQSDAPQEAVAASVLVDEGCVSIFQHSDNTAPATSAQDVGVFHHGYNNDTTGVAPEASLIPCRVDWTPYFVYAISAAANGEGFGQDWTAGYADGPARLTELNTAIVVPGTKEALEKAEADLAGGLHVFAGPLPGHPAQNLDGEAWNIGEGEFFPESDLSQEDGLPVPWFCYVIDGTTEE